jgi:hypothetical protein
LVSSFPFHAIDDFRYPVLDGTRYEVMKSLLIKLKQVSHIGANDGPGLEQPPFLFQKSIPEPPVPRRVERELGLLIEVAE